jgi:uncharacterized protein involved in exopolysaccharide biosynthesis
MLGHRQLSTAEYLGIWRRGRKWALASVLLGAAFGFLLAHVLPARYTSTASVEAVSRRSGDLVLPASEYTPARLAALRQQALTHERLQQLALRFGPQASENSKNTRAADVVQMEKDTVISPSAAGFTVSFTAGSPATAQQVCAELVSLLLQEESKNLQRDAAQQPGGNSSAGNNAVTGYLASEVAEAKRNLEDREARLAEFKRQHAGEFAGSDRNETERRIADAESQLEATDAALKRALQQRTAFTETLFAQQSAALQSRKAESSAATEALEQQLAAEQAQLVTLQTRYTPDHPDVVKLRADIELLQKQIEEAKKAAGENAAKKPDAAGSGSPQTAQLQKQIQELDALIQEKTREQGRLQQDILSARARLDTASLLGQEYRELTAQSATALSLYTSLLAKQSEARQAAQPEARRQEVPIRVSAAATLPVRPAFPDPVLFTLAGAGSGLTLGLLAIVAGEMRDKSLRTEGDVEYFLELPTLAVIPPVGPGDGSSANGDTFGQGGRTGKRGEKEQRVLADV